MLYTVARVVEETGATVAELLAEVVDALLDCRLIGIDHEGNGEAEILQRVGDVLGIVGWACKSGDLILAVADHEGGAFGSPAWWLSSYQWAGEGNEEEAGEEESLE